MKNNSDNQLNPNRIDDTSLYRYALWADMLRTQFETSLARDRQELESRLQMNQIVFDRKLLESEMYMFLWFGVLYIVIEGWPELRLNEPRITKLLRSRFKDLLRDFRNATFHPEDFDDARIRALAATGQESIDWAKNVTLEFNSFFESKLFGNKSTA
jgi:hypothetical protein